MKSSIAIVVPVFNPHADWEKILAERFNELCGAVNEYALKLYLINDGSSQMVISSSIDYIRQKVDNFKFIDQQYNRGKGFALRKAIASTSESFVIYTDVDMPFTLSSMLAIIDQLPHFDLVFGIKQRTYYEQLPLQRKIVSRFLQLLIRLLFPALPVSDTQCGLKGMNEKGKSVFLRTRIDRYLFDLEFILYAAKEKFRIKPIPVALREGIEFGNMKLRVLLEESRNLMKILRQK